MGRALVIAAIAGCYRPSPPEGAPCASTDQCAAPLVCDHQMCVRPGTDASFEIDARPDADLSCTCGANNQLECPSGTTACPAGCSTMGGPHCLVVMPSNGVTALFSPVPTPVSIIALATFNTDTGQITGAVQRAAGEGVLGGIGFQKQTFQNAPLGVFSITALDVMPAGTVHFTGSRAAVFVVEATATIGGAIDGSGGCYGGAKSCAGPGGGVGAIYTATPGGCGAGGPGVHDVGTGADSGGGGGGGGAAGAPGGTETASNLNFVGGAGGRSCIAQTLEPLVGGSGGGGGGPGANPTPTTGGGGGGAFQLTAFDTILVTGTINMGGGGGDTGPTDTNNGGAPGGGGAGGGILLEAPNVMISGTLAANGGGGGGASDHLVLGGVGQNGQASTAPAVGGAAANGGGVGGAGGALNVGAVKGGDSANVNSGAGGGGVGRIYVRFLNPPGATGVVSPAAASGTLRTQ
jgi:hypothetical protein